MKKLILIGLGAAAISASPAMAQSANASGTVQVTGSVASKCTAQDTGITGTIPLGELALSTGLVDSAFSNNTAGLTRSFTVVCTTANPKIEVSSTKLALSSDAASAGGYTGTVDYTSTLVADTNSGSSPTATAIYNTASNTAPTSTTLGSGVRFKNAANNLRVTVSNGSTALATDLLKAGTYGSTITITVYPS